MFLRAATTIAISRRELPSFPPKRKGTPWEGKEERTWPPELQQLILHCCSFDAVDRPAAEQALDFLLSIKDFGRPPEQPRAEEASEKGKEREKKAD